MGSDAAEFVSEVKDQVRNRQKRNGAKWVDMKKSSTFRVALICPCVRLFGAPVPTKGTSGTVKRSSGFDPKGRLDASRGSPIPSKLYHFPGARVFFPAT